MLTAEEIRNMEFQKSAVGGYKVADVEIFLEEIANNIEALIQQNAKYQKLIDASNKKIEEYHSSEGSIQNVLLSAQKLADQIVREANEASADITTKSNAKTRESIAAAEQNAKQLMETAERQAEDIIKGTIAKSESMISAAHDSVARQQLLFDKLKIEVANFKAALLPQYKEQVMLVNSLPDEIPFDPEHAAEAINFEFDKAPEFSEFVNEAKISADPYANSNKNEVKEDNKSDAINTTASEKNQETSSPAPKAPIKNEVKPTASAISEAAEVGPKVNGFKIVVDDDEDEEHMTGRLSFGDAFDKVEEKPAKGLFKKRK